jgi:hypothetical protein
LPDLVRTTEIYIVTCRNAGKTPEVARGVATSCAIEMATEYGMKSVPKLVVDRIERQIQKHHGRAPAPAKQQWIVYGWSAPGEKKVW